MWEESNNDLMFYFLYGKVHRLSSVKLDEVIFFLGGGKGVIKNVYTPILGYFLF